MFTIIISEKGGAERREAFERNEINVGRVQGNDLMLPKGNVSKHHARLLFRDGRFIVTDLKSTNGTYVNGRKISQATIVREGDKIYIGDFVLRLETGNVAGAPEASDDSSVARAVGAARAAVPVLRDASGSSAPPADAPTGVPPPPAMLGALSVPANRTPEQQAVSHFPLERDPDSESAPEFHPAALPRVPGPPRLPGDARPRTTTAMLGTPHAVPSPGPAPAAPPVSVRTPPKPTPQQAAYRKALIALVDRIADAVDLEPLDAAPVVEEELIQKIDAAAREQAKAMRQEGEAPESVDLEPLAMDALRELVGFGPLGALLDDEQAEEIHVPRPDVVLAVRDRQAVLVEPAFTSEEALSRVVARLAYEAGEPLRAAEGVIDRRLPRGVRMTAVAPPITSVLTLALRRQIRADGALDELVRVGAMSRAMASLLEACVAARANLLVVGSGARHVVSTIAALVLAVAAGERIALVADAEEIQVPHAYVTRIALGSAAQGDEALRAATRLRPDRLVIASLAGSVAAATVDAIAEGHDGVVAGLSAPSLRHALARLAAQVGLARPGSSIEAAREGIAQSFDVAVEMTRSIDGRTRVTRVAELAGADASGVVVRDLFVSNADGTGEAGFTPTGAAPRFLQDFAGRGVRLDPALFKRR